MCGGQGTVDQRLPARFQGHDTGVITWSFKTGNECLSKEEGAHPADSRPVISHSRNNGATYSWSGLVTDCEIPIQLTHLGVIENYRYRRIKI